METGPTWQVGFRKLLSFILVTASPFQCPSVHYTSPNHPLPLLSILVNYYAHIHVHVSVHVHVSIGLGLHQAQNYTYFHMIE